MRSRFRRRQNHTSNFIFMISMHGSISLTKVSWICLRSMEAGESRNASSSTRKPTNSVTRNSVRRFTGSLYRNIFKTSCNSFSKNLSDSIPRNCENLSGAIRSAPSVVFYSEDPQQKCLDKQIDKVIRGTVRENWKHVSNRTLPGWNKLRNH